MDLLSFFIFDRLIKENTDGQALIQWLFKVTVAINV